MMTTDLPSPETLPLIIAGPILRRTTAEAVTVWVALKEKRAITLHVLDETGTSRLIGSRSTVALGAHLHIAAVTARPEEDNPDLSWGERYRYNLVFGDWNEEPIPEDHLPLGDGASTLLTPGNLFKDGESADDLVLLRYPGSDLPGFTLCPPEDQYTKLRIFHASCRMPHGEGEDMLAQLDTLTADALSRQSETDPPPVPQLLCLTGDQIYADDVADQLLHLISRWSRALLVGDTDNADRWPAEEQIKVCRDQPCTGCDNGECDDRPVSSFLPGQREEFMERHGFSAGDVSGSHLIGIGEYYVMYLMAWSNRLWRVVMPSFAEIHPEEPELIQVQEPIMGPLGERSLDVEPKTVPNPLKQRFEQQNEELQKFLRALPKVRRALANVPSLMMMDDHEVTDDWYLNLGWCVDVLGNPFGKRVVQNGLAAYALFQGWGNTPEEFEPPEAKPGFSLLQAIRGWRGDYNDGNEQKLAQHLGIFHRGPGHRDLTLDKLIRQRSLDHPANAGVMDWHYRVQYPGFHILFLDTRTWRSFKQEGRASLTVNGVPEPLEPPELMSAAAVCKQVTDQALPEAGSRFVFVISPCPLFEVPWVDFFKGLRASFTKNAKAAADYEEWGYKNPARVRLLEALRDHVQPESGDAPITILLTGDIHYGYGCSMRFLQGEKPWFAHFTSSSLKHYGSQPFLTHFFGYVPMFQLNDWGDPEPRRDHGDNVEWRYIWKDKFADATGGGGSCSSSTGTPKERELKRTQCVAVKHRKTTSKSGSELVGKTNIGELRFYSDANQPLTQNLYWKDDENSKITAYLLHASDRQPRTTVSVTGDDDGQ